MRPETLLLLLILLACPLGMMFMMRGGHGGHGGMHGMHGDGSDDCEAPTVNKATSLDELRSQRDALEAEIADRESADANWPRTAARS